MSTTIEVTRAQRGRWLVGIALMVLPMFALTFLPGLSGAGGLVNVAILAAVAGFGVTTIVGAAAAVLSPGLMLLGLYVSGTPWLGTVIMVGLAIGVGWSIRRGMQIAALLVATQVAMVLIVAPFVGTNGATDPQSAKIVAGLAALGALWGSFVGSVFLHGQPRRTPDMEGVGHAWDRTGVLVVLVGIATALCMSLLAGTSAWWIVLTLLVILVPYGDESTNQMSIRTAVTTAVSVFAALVAVLLPFPAFTTLVGILVLIMAVAGYLRQRHWIFMALLSVAVIFLGFDAQLSIGSPSQKIAVTILSGLGVLVTTLVAQLVLRRREASA